MLVALLSLAFDAKPATPEVDLDQLLMADNSIARAELRGMARNVRLSPEAVPLQGSAHDPSSKSRVATEVVDPQQLLLAVAKPLSLTANAAGDATREARIVCGDDVVADGLRLESVRTYDPKAVAGTRQRQEGRFGGDAPDGRLRETLAVAPSPVSARKGAASHVLDMWEVVAIEEYDVEPLPFGSRRYHVSAESEHYALQVAPGSSRMKPDAASELNFVDARDQLHRGRFGSVRLSAPLSQPVQMAIGQAAADSPCFLEQPMREIS